MRNKFVLLSICVSLSLCPVRLYGAEAVSDTSEDTGEALSAEDEASITDLQDAEKGVQILQDKLQKREYDLMKRSEYEKVHASEMKKCDELKSEIWKLKDSAKALAAKLEKLASDKKNAEAELARQAEINTLREKDIRASGNEISAGDKQFKRLSEACEKENGERKEKLDKLKESLKSSADKIEALTREKNKLDDDLKAKDAEYKAGTDKLKALKDRPAPEKKGGVFAKKELFAKDEAPAQDEPAEIKKKMDELTVTMQKWDAAGQKLSEEILAAAEAKKSQEEEIKALENEGALKDKDLKACSEDLAKETKAAQAKIEKLKKKELSAKFKMQAASTSIKKLDDDIKKTEQEKHQAEKDLIIKTDELKVRISVLLGQYDENDLSGESYKKAPVKPASRGEELTAKLDKVFEAIKDENNRLMAENKTIQARLERAEKTATKARREAEEAVKAPEELKAKLNKERLDAHFNLAVVYEKNGLWHDAEREYLKCLRIDPKDPGVHYNLGILYDDKLNRNNKAMYHYYKYLSLRPMGDTAERVRDWITKLELENRLGKELR